MQNLLWSAKNDIYRKRGVMVAKKVKKSMDVFYVAIHTKKKQK